MFEVGEIEIQQVESGQNIKCATPFFKRTRNKTLRKKERREIILRSKRSLARGCDRWVDRDGWEGRRTTNAVRCYKRPCAETCDLGKKKHINNKRPMRHIAEQY
jgi:hypothetical protein